MKFEQLKDTDFFKFFHIHEIESICGQNGIVKKAMKPGGFKEFIDLYFMLLNDGTLTEASLLLDKNWIGSRSHLNPFANDIAKSFISLFGDADKNQDIKLLSNYIYHLKGLDDRVIYVQGQEPKIANLPDHLEGAVHVYLGIKEKWDLKMNNGTLQMYFISDPKPIVGIRIEYFK